ncbi:hypothetical protein PanWU01x14_131800 [Parasponia andersonii]|uniref:Uncharacterized protein n=1 Tax=Parasponia andersonii TaxID=3476 RepID=A0A2P5CQF7_PARAD|nr:hypothetical protein PanWU01x14_131800 [Parasponia andersonii]
MFGQSPRHPNLMFLSKTLGMWSFYNSFKIDYKRELFSGKSIKPSELHVSIKTLFDNHTSDLISSIIGKMEMHHFIRMIS